MVQIIQTDEITLGYLIDQFGVQLIEDEGFFPEWQTDLPTLTISEEQLLDKVRSGFLDLLNYPPMLEDSVRMTVT